MFTVTLRGMLAHRLRLLLTTASIALGVAFLAGTLVLTDTMGLAFDRLFGDVSAGTDAVLRSEVAPGSQGDGAGGADRAPVDESVLSTVAGVPGVRTAEGTVSGYALLTDNAGRAVVTEGGAPTMGYSMPADERLRGEVHVLTGAAPDGPGEVAIDASSAENHDIAVGSTISVLFQGPAQTFTVAGTVGFGAEKDLGGSTSAYFDTATAQRLLGTPGSYDAIAVSAAEGVSPAELAERLRGVAPVGTEAVTGAAVARESAAAVKDNLKVVSVVLTAFAGVALFVGSFIIWNTFTMIVTQRSRETALLRAIGATRRQVMRSLLLEALLVGAAASAVGVGLGYAVAAGLRALMDVMGLALPSTSLQLQPRTVVVSVVVGTVVTVVAALVPARRATKVLPVEALRQSTPGAEKPSRVRTAIGATLTVAGVAAVLAALYGDAGSIVLGAGLAAAMVGVLASLPLVVRPLASLVGVPLRMRGLPGELATQNAMRNSRRTAATAGALMVGLALVVSMGTFASSLKASVGKVLADQTNADLYLKASSAQAPGFSPTAVDAVGDVAGVDEVSPMGWGQALFDGEESSFSAVDPGTVERVVDLTVTQGSISQLDEEGVVVSAAAAKTNRWGLGDVVTTAFGSGGRHDLRVVAVYDGRGFLTDDYLLSNEAHTAFAGPQLLTAAMVTLTPGSDRAAVQRALTAELAGHPDTKVLDQKAFEREAAGFIDQLLTFVTVMLLLAVVIALLGIVNTLALSVFERTRELGLLRAVGMTRGQVRSMVRWESVVISLIGAVSGAGLGIAIGVALAQALKDEGITAISVPVGQVSFYVALAAVAGVLAAVGPARSAAKVDVLRAVMAD
jgi:putative ABC transport system permease protein